MFIRVKLVLPPLKKLPPLQVEMKVAFDGSLDG